MPPLIFNGQRITIEETVSQLRALGLEKGQILAAYMPTSLRLIQLIFASIEIGAIFCPLNLRLPMQAVEKQLELLQPKLFITESATTSFPSRETPLQSSSFLLFTSGSSGSPKIVNLSLANFVQAATTAIDVCNFKAGDTWLLSLPLFHVGGLSILFRAALSQGSVTTDQTCQTITHLSCVPTQLYRAWPIYPRLKTILLGGAPIYEIPSRLPILASYGMTETASMILGQKNAPYLNGFFYLGQSHKGKQLSLSHDGEILLKGDSLFQGYWDGVQLTPPNEWFATGDLGKFDAQNGFAIVGRKDNQFISGGENIQPEEIEKELLSHPHILEAIVVPKFDPEYGQRPVAFVRSNEFIDKNSLQKWLQERLPKYKVPCELFSLDLICDPGLKPSRKKILNFLATK